MTDPGEINPSHSEPEASASLDPAPPTTEVQASPIRFCRHCGAPWQPDWTDCPHCSKPPPVVRAGDYSTDIGRVKYAMALYFTLLGTVLVTIAVLLVSDARYTANVDFIESTIFCVTIVGFGIGFRKEL